MERLDILKKLPLFDDLSEQELKNIASRMTEKTCADGEVICRRGDPGGNLYLIKQGTAEVTLPLYRYEKKQPVISNLSEGMFFGEISFFDGKKSSADVCARGEMKLLELKKTDYDDIIAADPERGYNIQNKIILNLIRTIRKMNEKYSSSAFIR